LVKLYKFLILLNLKDQDNYKRRVYRIAFVASRKSGISIYKDVRTRGSDIPSVKVVGAVRHDRATVYTEGLYMHDLPFLLARSW
jgi:hypothetical protein